MDREAPLNRQRQAAQPAEAREGAVATLERALEIAAEAHAGQSQKDGRPYIGHPLRVMLPFVQVGDEERAIVAALHDVVGKSDWSLARLRAEGFSEAIMEAVDAMTRRDGEDYVPFVQRAGENALARPVKEADLRDNLATVRTTERPDRDELIAKYDSGLAALGVTTPRRD